MQVTKYRVMPLFNYNFIEKLAILWMHEASTATFDSTVQICLHSQIFKFELFNQAENAIGLISEGFASVAYSSLTLKTAWNLD